MNELVTLHGDKAVTTTLAITEGTHYELPRVRLLLSQTRLHRS